MTRPADLGERAPGAVAHRRPRAFQRIVAAIREDVFRRRLSPGDRVSPEAALAERFQVSRLAVREALRVLELQGIVRVEHGFQGGVYVTEGGSGPVTILDGVTLAVPAGQFLAVTGPSGSGKSTLLGLIAGLDRPTAGAIRVDGRDLGGLDEDALARLRRDRIGYVFQSFHLIPTLTALENVAVPLELAGAADPVREAAALLAEMGLGDRAHHYPAQLSGGEQQRVALARAVANRPALLLADEPTGNLDSRSSAEILAIFQRLNAQGKTVLMVTHEPDVAAHTKRIVRMRDGVVQHDEIVTDPKRAEDELVTGIGAE